MADNTTINAGTGGDTIASDDIGGVKHQRVKVEFGADGSASDVSTSNGLPIQGIQDSRSTGTITTSSSVVGPVAVSNRNVVTVDISGTHTGITFSIEASPDGGTTWFPIQAVNNATGQIGYSWTPGTNAAATYDLAVGAFTHVRVRATAYTSGTGNVGITGQVFAYDPAAAVLDQGLAAAGSAVLGNPVRVGGSDGTNIRDFSITAKATQGALGLATQDLKDSGRVAKVYYAANFTAATTEAMVTLTPVSDGTTSGTATSFTVTNGKRFRVQSLSVHVKNAGAAVQSCLCTLRINTAAATTTASPVQLQVGAGTPVATANAGAFGWAVVPDGLEILGNGTVTIGISQVGTATAGNWVTLVGYEY
jgi:hypothetical protein